jgi:hypothetical protein
VFRFRIDALCYYYNILPLIRLCGRSFPSKHETPDSMITSCDGLRRKSAINVPDNVLYRFCVVVGGDRVFIEVFWASQST